MLNIESGIQAKSPSLEKNRGKAQTNYKFIALVMRNCRILTSVQALLTFQTTVVVLCMRYSRSPVDPGNPASVYLVTTAVVMSELVKVTAPFSAAPPNRYR